MNGHDDLERLGTSIINRIDTHKDPLIKGLKRDKVLCPYVKIQKDFLKKDISKNRKFKSDFSNFYNLHNLRLSEQQKKEFFKYFQGIKTTDITFEQILEKLQKITKKVQASFASKLLHTKDPSNPIIDSRVLSLLVVHYLKRAKRKLKRAKRTENKK